MEWLNRCSLALFSLSLVTVTGKADSLALGSGMSSLKALSSVYNAQSTNETSFLIDYNHDLKGRWSIGALYTGLGSTSLSGYAGGLVYDFLGARTQAGELIGGEEAVVQSSPKWKLSGGVYGGSWHYIEVMTIAIPRPGEKPKATVEAQLYGVYLKINLQRAISQNYAAGLELAQVYSSSQNFSVTSTNFSLNATYSY